MLYCLNALLLLSIIYFYATQTLTVKLQKNKKLFTKKCITNYYFLTTTTPHNAGLIYTFM